MGAREGMGVTDCVKDCVAWGGFGVGEHRACG